MLSGFFYPISDAIHTQLQHENKQNGRNYVKVMSQKARSYAQHIHILLWERLGKQTENTNVAKTQNLP